MTQDLANQVQRVSIRYGHAREAMPKVVHPHIRQTGPGTELSPDTRHSDVVALSSSRRKDPWGTLSAGHLAQDRKRRCAQGHYFGACLGIRQSERLPLEINVLPLKRGDLASPGTGKDQEPENVERPLVQAL